MDRSQTLKRIANKLLYYLYCVISICFHVFPIKKNRIILWSYYYKKYACNPRYITEYLLDNEPDKYEIFWVFDKDTNPNIKDERIHILKWKSLRYFYILNTSHIIITNARMFGDSFFYKRRKQVYIQTWHSSMRLKKVEKDAVKSLDDFYIKAAKRDSNMCNMILSGSKFSTETIRRAFWYKGDILEIGTPRNDIFYKENTHIKDRFVELYNIKDDTKIILYAPTFRKNNALDVYDLNYSEVVTAFEKKLGVKCILLVRMHPNLIKSGYEVITDLESVIDVTFYDDMNELLIVSDFLITDYSSCMFDFLLLGRACFLYAPDYENYDRGTYFELQNLPFSNAKTHNQLINNIYSYDAIEYQSKTFDFNQKKIGSFENGKASEKVANYINSLIEID